jgi:hypothetical protein
LPYLTIRYHRTEIIDERGLRTSKPFLVTKDANISKVAQKKMAEGYKPIIYEGITSFLLIGIDEWFWTVHCIVDVFFKKNDPDWESARTYFELKQDAPMGNFCECCFPVWNPRQYLLRALRVRVRQVTKEWKTTYRAVQEILGSEVSDMS